MSHDLGNSVSIIIPCYNAGSYLREAIDSVLAQSYEPAEVIVVDDGSTDESGLIADSYFPLVKVLHGQHHGVGLARNEGIAFSKGTLLAFLDADDWWETEFLATRVRELERHPEVNIVIGESHWVVNGKMQEKGEQKPLLLRSKDAAVWLLKKEGFPIDSCLFRRTVLNGVTGFGSRRLGEDYEFWLRAFMNNGVFVSDKILSFYRQHGNQVSHGRVARIHWNVHRIARGFWTVHRDALGLPVPVGLASMDFLANRMVALMLERERRQFWALAWRVACFSPLTVRQTVSFTTMMCAAMMGEYVFLHAHWVGFNPVVLFRRLADRIRRVSKWQG